MKDQDKTKEQLISELADPRHRITELEASAAADGQAEESLRKTEASWRSLVENAPEKITSLDRDGTILFINRTTLGHTVEEVIGTSIYNYLPPAEQDITRRVLESVFQSGQTERYETVDVRPDGTEVVYSVSVAPVEQEGQVTAAIFINTDISERKRAEDAIQRRNQELAALNSIAAVVSQSLDLDEILNAGLDKMLELLGQDVGGIYLADLANRRLELVAHRGISQRYVDAIGSIDVDERSLKAATAKSRLGNLIFSVRTVIKDPRLLTRILSAMREEGLGFASTVPMILRAKERIVGLAIVSSHTRRRYSRAELQLLTGMGQQLAVAIYNAQLYETIQQELIERKRVEREREQLLTQIQEQAQQVQQIVDTVPEGVLLLDATGQIVLANPTAEKDLVVLADAKVGDSLSQLGDRPLDTLLASPPKGLWHEVDVDGQHFQIIARPTDAGPTAGGWVLVIRDVTQQREVERRIHQQQRLAAVGQLAAGIAHDFNNVMASIVLYAQMTARERELPDHVLSRMETIDQQARHATRLIQQILDFSRRAVLERQPLDLTLLLKEQVKLLERTLPESIGIRLTYGPDEHMVHADPTRIQQAITNLALNARDAMPDGGELGITLDRIEIKAGESPPLAEMAAGEWIRIVVSDTGTGIAPNVLPHIFEPFFTTRAPLGSGLGLAQVHGIVAQHKGAIDVETELGQGTSFAIYLPALPAHPSEPSTASLSRELPPLPLGRGETILVVEDDATVRRALVDSLELLGYQVLEAVNGQKALTMLEQHGGEVQLVVSDVVMPEMGGIALLHALQERKCKIGVVMLTGHMLRKELEDLRAQGMIDWLHKPPQLEQLANVVARALGTG
jgi:two-component system cell cycle sensor histidine kinase/response regulator CckA